MIWADRAAKDIIPSGQYQPYWVDDMKTPSGRIHVGSLRGVVMHDLIYKALRDAKQHVTFSYVFDDHDPMDALPIYLDKKIWSKHLGKPLFTIPSPDPTAVNYARFFAQEFQAVFNKIGCHPKIIWASELYKAGKMNDSIRLCLDEVKKIRKIYEELYKKKIADDWYPFQVACPGCGKESTTKVKKWDGDHVSFSCGVDTVDWTKGCGYEGQTSPFSNDGKFVGKLSWKVEWAVKWKVIGITIEGAGKDHMTRGGSHDVARMVSERVLQYKTPYAVGHEFFLVGGKKMSSSKGLGTSAREVSEMIPADLLRFLMVRTHINQAIDFDPRGMTIPDLFDEYDHCARAYWDKSDADLARIFELSQIDGSEPQQPLFLPRFRVVAHYIQMPNVQIAEKFKQEKGSPLTVEELKLLDERIAHAQKWLTHYAPQEAIFSLYQNLPGEVGQLSDKQKIYLLRLSTFIRENTHEPHQLPEKLYEYAKAVEIAGKDAFKAIYLSLLGKSYGPKAAALIDSLPRDQVADRFEEAAKSIQEKQTSTFQYPLLNDEDIFSISGDVRKKFPSIILGIAIIKGVTIRKENRTLTKRLDEFIETQKDLTTEKIGSYQEIQSYRRLYKEMGIDWHSRRPSPEALLRRIALQKGLYHINACVDAYNLVVVKNHVSSGAFDLDTIVFPTMLRFAKPGEQIVLLGDQEPTQYTSKELAYFDQVGGYNIDFNFRDAKRTQVTEKTKNLYINVDGVYDIDRGKVETTLKETIEEITRYCGGTVKLAGIVSAKS